MKPFVELRGVSKGFDSASGRMNVLEDVNLEVARSFHRQRPVARWAPHPIAERLVARGHLGRKSGQGFYRYREGKPEGAALPVAVTEAPATAREVSVHGTGPIADLTTMNVVVDWVRSNQIVTTALTRLVSAHSSDSLVKN